MKLWHAEPFFFSVFSRLRIFVGPIKEEYKQSKADYTKVLTECAEKLSRADMLTAFETSAARLQGMYAGALVN